jgi:SHS2 domain-containing protein
MSKQISHIPHVADVCLKIKGSTINELFEAGLEGMGKVLNEKVCLQYKEVSLKEAVNLSSIDITALLIDFLSKVLTLSHLNRAVYCRFESLEISGSKLIAVVEGYPVDEFDEDIKAVTYHAAEVKECSEGQWETIILFDI